PPLQPAHLALAAGGADVRRPARRAQGARLRRLRGSGPAGARDRPGRQHGTARARGLRALPGGARRGAGRVTAILLAAGVGKRLLGFSNGRPKCLIEIGGKSLLVRLLEGLAAAGVREAAVVVGFGEDAVRAAVGDGPPGIRPGYELAGESVGFLKLAAGAARVLRELLELRVAAGHTAIEHEEVYPELLERVVVGFERVDGMPWTEIDFPEDVARAEREVLPRIEP